MNLFVLISWFCCCIKPSVLQYRKSVHPVKGSRTLTDHQGLLARKNSQNISQKIHLGIKEIYEYMKVAGLPLHHTGWFTSLSSFSPLLLDLIMWLLQNLACPKDNRNDQRLKIHDEIMAITSSVIKIQVHFMSNDKTLPVTDQTFICDQENVGTWYLRSQPSLTFDRVPTFLGICWLKSIWSVLFPFFS